MAKLVYFVINRRILFYICVWLWNVGLRLVIVVVTYKIFNTVLWKELFEFTIKLTVLMFCYGQVRGLVFALFEWYLPLWKFFREPVTPRSVWNFLPSIIPLLRYSIAFGWSPVGLYSECNLNIFPPFCDLKMFSINLKFVKVKISKWNY